MQERQIEEMGKIGRDREKNVIKLVDAIAVE